LRALETRDAQLATRDPRPATRFEFRVSSFE
jgi:hypothetical protein